ncbi:AAA family ATPase [Arcobacteraceae bacterium]|nr:AAA family ATPase [Arcobacteraceae bacterium]
MEKHLLEYIEIKDFKCFKDFEAKGFKRVNLIGGKNNVGKTAFMEACFVNTHSSDIDSIFRAIASNNYARNILEQIGKKYLKDDLIKNFEYTKYHCIHSNVKEIETEIINSNGRKEYKFVLDKDELIINANDFSYQLNFIKNIKFINNLGFTNKALKEIYTTVQKKDKEDILYKFINEFDNNIDKFKIMGGENPECKVIDRDEYQNINEFGDGLKHYISIICSLYACENGYLFIDEIDNGIHYTQLDRLWEIILTISKEQNVQVFATTHSKECIDAYVRVSKKIEDEEICFIELGKNDNKLESITYNYEEVISQVTDQQDLRGW